MPGIVLAGQRVLPSQFTTTIANLATGSVTNTTSEAVIGSFAVPVASAGQGFGFHVEGTNDNAAAAVSLTFAFRLGTTGTTSDLLVSQHGAITTSGSALTNRPWSMDGWIRVIAGGSSGSVMLTDHFIEAIPSTSTGHDGISLVTSPVNWTVPNILTVTAQWGAASASDVTRTLTGSLAGLN